MTVIDFMECWQFTLICFVLSWDTGFVMIWMALVLLVWRIGRNQGNPISEIRPWSQVIFEQADDIARNSASVEDLKTCSFSFLNFFFFYISRRLMTSLKTYINLWRSLCIWKACPIISKLAWLHSVLDEIPDHGWNGNFLILKVIRRNCEVSNYDFSCGKKF